MCNIRKKARDARKNIDKKLHYAFSQKICQKIQQFITDKNVIMLYNAIDGEVDVKELKKIPDKTFLFPRVEGEKMIAVKSDRFFEGSYGITEPIGEEYRGTIDAVIVPLCAFDDNCNRLGFGKGYYDRFLNNKNCLKIGAAFSCQKTNEIEIKETDIKMDVIITEKEILESVK